MGRTRYKRKLNKLKREKKIEEERVMNRLLDMILGIDVYDDQILNFFKQMNTNRCSYFLNYLIRIIFQGKRINHVKTNDYYNNKCGKYVNDLNEYYVIKYKFGDIDHIIQSECNIREDIFNKLLDYFIGRNVIISQYEFQLLCRYKIMNEAFRVTNTTRFCDGFMDISYFTEDMPCMSGNMSMLLLLEQNNPNLDYRLVKKFLETNFVPDLTFEFVFNITKYGDIDLIEYLIHKFEKSYDDVYLNMFKSGILYIAFMTNDTKLVNYCLDNNFKIPLDFLIVENHTERRYSVPFLTLIDFDLDSFTNCYDSNYENYYYAYRKGLKILRHLKISNECFDILNKRITLQYLSDNGICPIQEGYNFDRYQYLLFILERFDNYKIIQNLIECINIDDMCLVSFLARYGKREFGYGHGYVDVHVGDTKFETYRPYFIAYTMMMKHAEQHENLTPYHRAYMIKYMKQKIYTIHRQAVSDQVVSEYFTKILSRIASMANDIYFLKNNNKQCNTNSCDVNLIGDIINMLTTTEDITPVNCRDTSGKTQWVCYECSPSSDDPPDDPEDYPKEESEEEPQETDDSDNSDDSENEECTNYMNIFGIYKLEIEYMSSGYNNTIESINYINSTLPLPLAEHIGGFLFNDNIRHILESFGRRQNIHCENWEEEREIHMFDYIMNTKVRHT